MKTLMIIEKKEQGYVPGKLKTYLCYGQPSSQNMYHLIEAYNPDLLDVSKKTSKEIVDELIAAGFERKVEASAM